MKPAILRLAMLMIGLMLASTASASGSSRAMRAYSSEKSLLLQNLKYPAGFAHWNALVSLHPALPDYNQLPTFARALLNQPRKLSPLLNHRIRYWLANESRQRGAMTDARTLLGPLGLITDWWLVGTFDNLGNKGHLATYAPESTEPGSNALFETTGSKSSWRHLPNSGLFGFNFRLFFPKAKQRVAYLGCWVYFARKQWVALRYGASDSVTIWFGETKVVQKDVQRPARQDQNAVGIMVPKGWTRLLVKSAIQTSRGWRLYLRFTELNGQPLKGFRRSTTRQTSALATNIPSVEEKPAGPLAQQLRRLERSKGSEQKWREAMLAGQLIFSLRPYDADLEKCHSWFNTLAKQRPSRPLPELWMSRCARNDVDKRRDGLEAALKLAKTPAMQIGILQRLAQYYASRRLRLKSIRLRHRLLKLDPDNLWARLAAVRETQALGFPLMALSLLKKLEPLCQNNTRFLLAMAHARRKLLQPRHALKIYRLLATRTQGGRYLLAHALLRMRLPLKALKVLGDMQVIAPYDVTIALRRSLLESANRSTTTAIATLENMRRFFPTDNRLLTKIGYLHQKAGSIAKATKIWRLALRLHPQNTRLKRYLQHLGQIKSIHERYALPLDQVIKRRIPEQFAASQGVYLLDLQVIRMRNNGLSDRFVQRVIRIQSNQQLSSLRRMQFSFVPGQQRLRLLAAEVRRANGDIAQPTLVKRYRPYGKIGGVYQNIAVQVVAFDDLRVGDTIHIKYRLDDLARDNMFGKFFGAFVPFQTVIPKLEQRYVVELPAGRTLYSYEHRIGKPTVTVRAHQTYRWVARNLPGITSESGMPAFPQVGAYLNVSTYRDWKTLATWYHRLVKQQFKLNLALKTTVSNLIKGTTSERQKVTRIHNWVVKNTRYVGIEFGIHGFKPYHVNQVFKRKYGDCKDKASLMIAMLRHAGIAAELVIIRTSDRGTLHSFPATLWAFNHAIAYVPKFKLYLDGTAEFSGTTELPWQDQGAMAILIDAKGRGRLVRTPQFRAAQNTWTLKAHITLSADGSALFKATQVIVGSSAARMRQRYGASSYRNQLLETSLAGRYPGSKIKSSTFSDLDQLEQPVRIAYEATIPRLAKRQGAKLELKLALFPLAMTSRFARTASRTHPLIIRQLWREHATIVYLLPAGYRPHKLSDSIQLSSRFADYRQSYRTVGNKIIVTFDFISKRTKIKPSEYKAFREFCLKVDSAVDQRLLLRP